MNTKFLSAFIGVHRRLNVLLASCLLAACGHYSQFTLPQQPGGNPNLTFEFEPRPDPVISRGSFHDVLNPSVVRAPEGLLNYYSAFDGRSWQTLRATSSDGIHWGPPSQVLSTNGYIAANGSAIWYRGGPWYWYQTDPKANPRIALLRTRQTVLDYGPYMSWDERALADPYVIRIDPYFYMYYLGQDRADPPRQRLGLARSTDGVRWEKLRSNPILEPGGPGSFDENGEGEPAVWSSYGFYWMLYTGRDAREHRRLGLARSTDGVHWTKLPQVFAGPQPWDSVVICDPTVLVENSEIRVWFGGGDIASPDENLHGQIGYGTLRPVDATLAK